jgi:hypothetical protein
MILLITAHPYPKGTLYIIPYITFLGLIDSHSPLPHTPEMADAPIQRIAPGIASPPALRFRARSDSRSADKAQNLDDVAMALFNVQ